MEKKVDVWVVIEKNGGDPLEGAVTSTMSPALRDFYNRSRDFAVVQAALTYELPPAEGRPKH